VKILWIHLKKFFTNTSSCNSLCNQGRNCNCNPYGSLSVGEYIIKLHELASNIKDSEESIKVRLLADELAKIGNRLHEKNSRF
jgi:hypothetical protein